MLELSTEGMAKSELVNESLPWLLEVLFGDLIVVPGEGGVLAGRANAQLSRFACMIPNSNSDPELISADTLLSSRAKVTFFSNLGSVRVMCAEVLAQSFPINFVSFTSSLDALPNSFDFLSLICISSPKLSFWDDCFVGAISC